MSKNKVEFGLSKVHVSFWDETTSNWLVPMPIPGAVSFSPSAESEEYKFAADDDANYYYEEYDNGYTGDLSMARLPDWFLGRALGYRKDKTTGAIVEVMGAKRERFCLLFEGKGDAKKVRRMYINATAGKPTEEFKTIEGTPDVRVNTVPLTILGDSSSKQIAHKLYEGDEGYDDFFTTAPVMSAPADLEAIPDPVPAP